MIESDIAGLVGIGYAIAGRIEAADLATTLQERYAGEIRVAYRAMESAVTANKEHALAVTERIQKRLGPSFAHIFEEFHDFRTVPASAEHSPDIPSRGSVEVVPIPENIFIAHGHDHQGLRELEAYLRRNGLNPIICIDRPKKGRQIFQIVREDAADCSCAIALFSPDDEVKNQGQKYRQARPNVMIEAGWLMATLGPRKVILVSQADMRMPSDFGGLAQVQYQSALTEALLEITQELKALDVPL